MKKGTVFTAPPGAGNKKGPLFEAVISSYENNDFSRVLYIAPNSFVLSAARDSFFSFFQRHRKKQAFIPVRFMTIKQLAGGLYEDHGGNRIVSDRMRILILCEFMKDRNIGFAVILADLLKKIRHYLPDTELRDFKDKIGRLICEEKAASRAVKAIEILESYEAELEGKGLIDPEQVLKECIAIIRQDTENNKNSSLHFRTLVIDGFFDPTPLEMEIMGGLTDHAENVYVMAEENTEIIRYLHSRNKGMTVSKIAGPIHRKTTGHYSYPSVEEEVEGIARNLKKLLLEGTKPWDITVTFPVVLKYLPMVRRVFSKYGVPLSIGECGPASTGPVMALDDLITSVEEDYARRDFLSLLTSPHFPLVPPPVRENALRYSYMAGVVKGRESWISIKDTLLNSMQDTMTGDEKELLTEFQRGINRIIDTIDNIKQQDEPALFMEAFESALAVLGFFESLHVAGPDTGGDMISDRINSRLSEFRYFTGLYSAGSLPVNKPVFYLKYLLSNLQVPEENRNGVRILPFELAAGLETGALFFGGMLEGDFPSRPDIDPILPEQVKKQLGMPYLEYYLKRQKKYFLRLLNISARDPFFSCPSADGDKVFLPSPFLDWEMCMTPPELNIFTEEEALVRRGAARFSSRNPGVFQNDEMFRSGKALSALRRKMSALSKGHFSVTDIDYYRKCPLRFYIERVLGLKADVPPRFEIEARLWGTLAHKTMEHLFKDGAVAPDELEGRLSQGLEKSLRQFPVGDFWAKVAREIFTRLLPLLKDLETDIMMQGYAPVKVEEKLRADINSLKLKGKIDRVDRRTQNSEHRTQSTEHGQQTTDSGQRETVALIDYKTGNIDRESLQLPLYAAMWQNLRDEPVEKTGYYSLKDGRATWLPGKKPAMEEFISGAVQKTEELIKQMKEGVFTPEPFKPDECRYCYHKPLCKQ